LEIAAQQRGFMVERTYVSEDKDHPEFVKRDAQGHWRIKKGSTLRVKLNIVRAL